MWKPRQLYTEIYNTRLSQILDETTNLKTLVVVYKNILIRLT